MNNDFEIHQIILPEDEYDEDDELDARLDAYKRKRRNRVDRGGFFGTN